MIDNLYDEAFKPEAKPRGKVYGIAWPSAVRSRFKSNAQPYIAVEVDVNDGQLTILPSSYWFSGDYSRSAEQIHKEIAEWLVEWELAAWRRIGPEDRELFATKKLDYDLGVDV